MNLLTTLFETLILILLSAIFSGLNIALLSLNLADLKRKALLGNKYAVSLMPLRERSHLTLASILLSNVAVISASSLVLEKAFNGWIAGVASTLLIVIFGEVLPQALFARNALVLTGRFVPFLKVLIIITYPVTRPLEIILDKILGHEASDLQSRAELGFMLAEHSQTKNSELDEDEVEIIQGALQLSEKHAKDIMTPIDSVYWVTPDTDLDAAKIDEIKIKGYSRIPILNRRLTKVYGYIHMKDLVDIDFDNNKYDLGDIPNHPSSIVGGKTALDTLFRKFTNGNIHLFPIETNDKIVGIVTIEDLLEEILQHEIVDETDKAKQRD